MVDRGRAGASAGREYERRKVQREARTRAAHPIIGDALLAVRGQPQHETAFRRGAAGEAAVAESLERRVEGGSAILLHDRRMPRGRGNIDHLAVAPAGVFVIDAKDWSGKVRVATPLLGASKLLIAGRDRTSLIEGLERQVVAVHDTLGSADVPIHSVLCFTKADLPLLGVTRIRGHVLLYRKALAKRLNASGPLGSDEIESLARQLAIAFPPA